MKEHLRKEMEKENELSESKFRPEDLSKLKRIVEKEVDKEPPVKHNDEQKNTCRGMDDEAKECSETY